MLADGAAARAVWCGPGGLLAGCRSGCVAVDMSTIGPNAAREIAAEAERHGADFLDAPVSGSTALAGAGHADHHGRRVDDRLRAGPAGAGQRSPPGNSTSAPPAPGRP